MKELESEQYEIIKARLDFWFKIGRISAYEYGQLRRYIDDIQNNKKPYLDLRKRKNEKLRLAYEQLIKIWAAISILFE